MDKKIKDKRDTDFEDQELPMGIDNVPVNEPNPKYKGRDLPDLIAEMEKDGLKVSPITKEYLKIRDD